MNPNNNDADSGASHSDAGLAAGDWRDEWDACTYIGPRNPPPTKAQIAARLRKLAAEMDDIAVDMDYYGGLAAWAQHGREIAGAGKIAREWAAEIVAADDSNSGLATESVKRLVRLVREAEHKEIVSLAAAK